MQNFGELMHNMLTEFHDAFGYDDDPALRKTLIMEEARELLSATSLENMLKEACDYMYVITGTSVCLEGATDLLMQKEFSKGNPIDFDICLAATAIVDQLTKYVGPEVIAEAFTRVHASNMSKLGPDGKPVLREDGKRLKGPNYKPADLSDLVRDPTITLQ